MFPAVRFKRSEFACKCGCGFDTVDAELLNVLMSLRRAFGSKVNISSACRCPSHNLDEGGGVNSQHLYGRAADITVSGINPDAIFLYLCGEYPKKYGIGSYATFTHIDTRLKKARW